METEPVLGSRNASRLVEELYAGDPHVQFCEGVAPRKWQGRLYSTHITSQSFSRWVNILARHAEDREYKFRRPRHLSYILSSLIGFFIAHLTI